MIADRTLKSALLVASVALSTGCTSSGLGVVPRYPYVEDRGLALEREVLTLQVERSGSVRVHALFRFIAESAPRDRVATFPIGGPRKVTRGFRATLPGRDPSRLPVAPGDSGALPMGSAVAHWDIWLDGQALKRHDGWLSVRYEQPGSGDFGYVLKSGAYWRGPIRSLTVILEDPHTRVAALSVEGKRMLVRGRERTSVKLRDVEPKHRIRLELL